MPLPTPRVYATSDDYQQHVGSSVMLPARIDYQLQLASAVIDYAMTGAIYDTDDNGLPTDPDVASMMCLATCQQVEYQVDTDDDTGAKSRFDSVSISGVSMHRAPGTAGNPLPDLAQQAALTLFNASALPGVARQGRY
jgi:hypothetical protein